MTKKDILEALGVEMGSDRFTSGLLFGIGIGALSGAVLALLFAPSAGVELRGRIGEKSRNLMGRFRKGEVSAEMGEGGYEGAGYKPNV